MTWPGRSKWYSKIGGRFGGMVRLKDDRLGEVLVPRHAFFEVEGENGHPDLHMAFEVRDNRPECVEVRVVSKENGRGLRTLDLQLLAIDAMTTNVFAGLAMPLGRENPDGSTVFRYPEGERERWSALRAVDNAVKAPGRGVSRAELERVAQIYRECIDSSPTRAVAALYPYKSERTAARRVQQAREAGLLPPTTPGKRKA